MNKRIREFAIQSGFSFKYKTAPDKMNPGHGLKELEKFAELIVRECAQLVQGVPTDTMGYHTADQKIKEYFGVK